MSDCRCGRATRDEAYVCDGCLDGFSRALGEVPWADAELDLTLTGQRGVDYRRGGGARPSEARLPVNMGASEAQSHLRATLVAWVKFCAEEKVRHQSPHTGLPADNMAAMSRWLMWRVDGLGLLDIGPEAVSEVTLAVERSKRVIDRPADKWYAGPCDATEECVGELYATSKSGNIACPECGAGYDVAARREWLLEAAEDRLVNAADLARAVSWLGTVPLTAHRVRQWAVRERIFARGHDGKSPLYRVGDAIDLLAQSAKVG